VAIARHLEKLCSVVQVVEHETPVPREHRHIGNAVFVARHIATGRQITIEHIELALDL
jgi:hypothetical protein